MIADLSKCVKDGSHAHGSGTMYNHDDGPGPLCDKHKNEYLQENGKDRTELDRDYTQPDERTSAWKEYTAHKAQEERHRILSGRRWDEL